jgi:hypothetical protein
MTSTICIHIMVSREATLILKLFLKKYYSRYLSVAVLRVFFGLTIIPLTNLTKLNDISELVSGILAELTS